MKLTSLLSFKPVALLLLAGFLGLACYLSLRNHAFHWSTLDLQMTRAQAIEKSKEHLAGLGFDLQGSHSSAIFWNYETPAIYFEKTAGTTQANAWLASDSIPIRGWETRFFWTQEKEEYRVWWSPKGRLVGWEHLILREKKLPSLESKAAEELAQKTVQTMFPEEAPSYHLIERSSDKTPYRTNHSFRWEAQSAPLESRQFIQVSIAGNAVRAVRKELEVPETFHRNERRVASSRNLLGNIAQKLNLLLTLVAFIFLLKAWRRHWLRWKPMIFWTGLLFVVAVAHFLNQLPLQWHRYSTHQTLSAFWIYQAAVPLLFLLASTAWLILPFASADAMGRTVPWTRYSFGDIPTKAFWHSKFFFEGTLAGFGMAGIQLGFVVLFYVFGRQWLGFYAPQDVQFDNFLTTTFPWLAPLLVGLKPALVEETLFRLFAIPLVWRWTKSKWIAVLAPAILWGFLHTGYYVEPIYARGLELTLVGVLLGWVYLKYGIWATIVGHFVYNATISSTLLLSSGNTYFQAATLLVISFLLFPLAWSSWKIFQGKKFSEIDFRPLKKPPSPPSEPPVSQERRRQNEPHALPLNPALGIIAVCLFLIFVLPGKAPRRDLKMDRGEAIVQAQKHLQDLGFSAEGYLVTAESTLSHPEETVLEYLKNRLSAEKLDRFVREHRMKEPIWLVQFQAPKELLRFNFSLENRGKLRAFSYTQPEETPGVTLSQGESKEIATKFLGSQGIQVEKIQYLGAIEHQRTQRLDILHRWEVKGSRLGEMQEIIHVALSGDRVAKFNRYFQLPESYLRILEEENSWHVLRTILSIALMLLLLGLVVRALFDRQVVATFRNPVPWSAAFLTMGLMFLGWLNEWPNFWENFDSTTTTTIYAGDRILNMLGQALIYGVGSYLVTLLFIRVPPQVFPEAPQSQDLMAMFKRPPWRWRGGREGFAWAFALLTFGILRTQIFNQLSGELPLDLFQTTYGPFSTFFPGFTWIPMFWTDILSWAALAVGLSVLKKTLGLRFGGTLFLGTSLLVMVLTPDQNWGAAANHLVGLLILAFIILRIIRFHIPFYFWFAFLSAALSFMPWLFSETLAFRQQAALILLIILFMFSLLFVRPPFSRPRSFPPS